MFSLSVTNGPLPMYHLIQPSTLYEGNLCFSKSSQKLENFQKCQNILSAESVEVSVELSDDCYNCNLSLPIPNEQTLDRLRFSQQVLPDKEGRHCYLKKKDA